MRFQLVLTDEDDQIQLTPKTVMLWGRRRANQDLSFEEVNAAIEHIYNDVRSIVYTSRTPVRAQALNQDTQQLSFMSFLQTCEAV